MSNFKEKLNSRRGRKVAERQLLARKYIEEVANEWSGGNGYRSMLSKEISAYRFMLEKELREIGQRLYKVENAVSQLHDAANDLEKLKDEIADSVDVERVSFSSFSRAYGDSVESDKATV